MIPRSLLRGASLSFPRSVAIAGFVGQGFRQDELRRSPNGAYRLAIGTMYQEVRGGRSIMNSGEIQLWSPSWWLMMAERDYDS